MRSPVGAWRSVGEFNFRTCFVAGTLVKVHPNTPNSRQIKGESYKEIDQLRIGDLVLSADEHTGELSYRPATELFVHDVKLIHRLTYKEGLTIETTWNHPFWVQDKGWTEAKDLHAGERSVTAMSILKAKQPHLQTVSFTSNVQPGYDDPSLVTWDDAREGTLSVARVEEVHRADKVYNIEVEGNHTYFVTEEGVLVHNYQTVPPTGFSRLQDRLGNKLNAGTFDYDRFGNTTVNSGFLGGLQNFGESVWNTITGYGYNTNAEVALAAISGGHTLDEKISLSFGEKGGSISRNGGSSGVDLAFSDGHKTSLSGTETLSYILNGAADNGLDGAGLSAPTLEGFLSANLAQNGRRFAGGNGEKDLTQAYGSGQYNYDATLQAKPESAKDEKLPFRLSYCQYGDDARCGPVSDPRKALSNPLNCEDATVINDAKAAGLIRPDASIYDVARMMGNKYGSGGNAFAGNSKGFFQELAQSDYAKLTGADRFTYQYESVSQAALPSVLSGGEVVRGQEQDNIGHNITVVAKQGETYILNNPLGRPGHQDTSKPLRMSVLKRTERSKP